MHIIIDARIINSSTGRYVQGLLRYLQEVDQENQYSILVPSKDVHFWRPTNPNFTIHTIDIKNYSVAEQTKLKTFLEELKPDLVHFCMPQQPLGYKGKRVTTVHDMTLLKTYSSDKNWLVYRIKQLVGRYVFKAIATKNAFILAPSEHTKREYTAFSGLDPSRVVVTYEASEPFDSSNTVLDITPADIIPTNFSQYILYVGQQSDYKNIPRLAEAHQQLLAQYPQLGLVLVGNRNAATERNEVLFAKNGYRNIHFTGFISDHELDCLYLGAAVYAFPSLMEGFGLPGLEAMAHGVPVVSSNQTCLPEVYGEAAYYFDPFNVDDIAQAIDKILSQPDFRQELIRKGYEQAGRYSWRRMAEMTHRVYMQAILS